MLFFHLKSFFRSQDTYVFVLSFCSVHVAKRLDQKDEFNFKFNDVTTWLANNLNAHIVQYFEK